MRLFYCNMFRGLAFSALASLYCISPICSRKKINRTPLILSPFANFDLVVFFSILYCNSPRFSRHWIARQYADVHCFQTSLFLVYTAPTRAPNTRTGRRHSEKLHISMGSGNRTMQHIPRIALEGKMTPTRSLWIIKNPVWHMAPPFRDFSWVRSGYKMKLGIQRVQTCTRYISRSRYVAIATQSLHRLQICSIVHN